MIIIYNQRFNIINHSQSIYAIHNCICSTAIGKIKSRCSQSYPFRISNLRLTLLQLIWYNALCHIQYSSNTVERECYSMHLNK